MIARAPITLVLNLWSLGHSAADIRAKLGLPNDDVVKRIVRHGREIEDPRAVYHVTSGGRIQGEKEQPSRWRKQWKGFAIVRAIEPPRAKTCMRGHLRTDDNLFNRGCLVCKRERQRLAYHAKKDRAG